MKILTSWTQIRRKWIFSRLNGSWWNVQLTQRHSTDSNSSFCFEVLVFIVRHSINVNILFFFYNKTFSLKKKMFFFVLFFSNSFSVSSFFKNANVFELRWHLQQTIQNFFSPALMLRHDKLESLSPESIFSLVFYLWVRLGPTLCAAHLQRALLGYAPITPANFR